MRYPFPIFEAELLPVNYINTSLNGVSHSYIARNKAL